MFKRLLSIGVYPFFAGSPPLPASLFDRSGTGEMVEDVRIDYLTHASEVRVIRVLHGKRDVRHIREKEGEEEQWRVTADQNFRI